jgi:hypothetical protein
VKSRIATTLGFAVLVAAGGWAMGQEKPLGERPAPATKPAPATRPATVNLFAAPKPEYTGRNPKMMAATAGTPDNTPPAGFVGAFNGKDLAGWQGLQDPKKKLDNPFVRAAQTPEAYKAAQAEADENMKAHWTPTDGVLVFEPGEKKTGRSLCTAKQYGDFEMWVSWKIKAGGDSGVYLRGCPQVQIWDTSLVRVGGEVGSGSLYNNLKHPAVPLVVADYAVGEWNTFFIRMVGDKVTVYLNGQLVVDDVMLENYWDRSKLIPAKEQIELQNHGNTLYFKNVYIKDLTEAGK